MSLPAINAILNVLEIAALLGLLYIEWYKHK